MVRGSTTKAQRPKWIALVWAALVLCASPPLHAETPLEPFPGSLVISELMVHSPPEVEFPLGQWFEIYNASDDEIALAGLVLEVVSDEKFDGLIYALEVGTAPVLPGHGYLVLGASKALALNGGVPVNYAYGPDFVLPKKGGSLRLLFGEELLDEILYGPDYGMATPAGASLNLEPDGLTPQANNQVEFWCPSTSPVAGTKPLVHGTPGKVGHTCDSDGDGFDEAKGDCNDFDPKVSPGAQEKCNGLDDDCNGDIDDGPLSDTPAWGDVGVCKQGGPVCQGDDGWTFELPDAWQENETLCDSLDNDCDGDTDEGLRNACGHCGSDELDLCDGEDNDCDGDIDEDALEAPQTFACDAGTKGVCNDAVFQCGGTDGWLCELPDTYQDDEALCDNLDNDCDGDIDEGYDVGIPCAIGEGICRNQGTTVCSEDGLGVMCVGEAAPGLVELCGDNEDNDCDGLIDEDFAVGDTCEAGVGACRVTGKLFCSADRLSVECSVEPLEPVQEICLNFIDDDCDGVVDEVECGEDSAGTVPQGCGAAAPGTSTLTFLLLLIMPVLAHRRRWLLAG